jgi:hypothetical protein
MSCLDLSLSHHDQLVWSIGALSNALLTGGVVTSGIASIFLLLSTKNRMARQNRLLRSYVVVLILVILGYDCLAIIRSQANITFCFQTQQEVASMFETLGRVAVLFEVAVAALTDGILVRTQFLR